VLITIGILKPRISGSGTLIRTDPVIGMWQIKWNPPPLMSILCSYGQSIGWICSLANEDVLLVIHLYDFSILLIHMSQIIYVLMRINYYCNIGDT